MIYKPKSYFLLIVLLLTFSCHSVTRNEGEMKIQGKWSQTGGLPNPTSLIDFTFSAGKEFIQEFQTAKNERVVYGSPLIQKGVFQIKNDSLYLYHGENKEEAFYTSKILFTSLNKFILLDGNGEQDFERQQ